MKKKMVMLIICFSVIALLLTGCGTKDTPQNEGSNNEVIQEEIKPVEFRFHHQNPPSGGFGQAIEAWAQDVYEKTDGIVKVTVYPNATLGPGPKGYELTQDGIADLAWCSLGLYPSRFPITETLTLPMQGLNSGSQSSKVAWELYKASEAVQKEWEDSKAFLLTIYASGYSPIGMPKEVKSIDDFKGKTIRTIAGGPAELLKRMGASPVIIPPMEIYQQIEKGVLDGWTIDWQAAGDFSLSEITPFIHEFSEWNYYVSTHFVVMNKESYEKIPDKYKPVFDSLTGEYFAKHMGDFYQDSVAPEKQKAMDNKSQILTFPADVEAKAKAIADEIAAEHAQKLDSEGKAGTETVNLLRELTSQYK